MGKRVCPQCGAVEDEDTYTRYQVRIEAAERDRNEAERERDYYRKFAHERHEQYMECQATLAAVREKLETICNIGETRDVEVAREALAIIYGLSGTASEIDSRTTRGLRDKSRSGGPTESILDGEGE